MVNIFNKEELEKLLSINWTKYIDPRRMISLLLSSVRDADLIKVKDGRVSKKDSVQVTVSQISVNENGYLMWVDFNIPRESGTAVGTTTFHLNPFTGDIKPVQTYGIFIDNPTLNSSAGQLQLNLSGKEHSDNG